MSFGTMHNNVLIETTLNEHVAISYKIDEDNYINLYEYEGDLKEYFDFLEDADDWHQAFYDNLVLQKKLLFDVTNEEQVKAAIDFYFEKKELEKTNNVASSFSHRMLLSYNDDNLVLKKDDKAFNLSKNYNILHASDTTGIGNIFLEDKITSEKVRFNFIFDGDKFYADGINEKFVENDAYYGYDLDVFEYVFIRDFVEHEKIKERKRILACCVNAIEIDEIVCGDTWFEINHPSYEHGLFVQVESKELDDGEYSDDIFCLYAYKNIGLDADGKMETDYSDSVCPIIEFKKEEIVEIKDNLKEKVVNDEDIVANEAAGLNDDGSEIVEQSTGMKIG